jgi:hypothetical protein
MGGSQTVGQDGIGGTLGQPATANIPGARQSAQSWVDSSGNFWLFGGLGVVGAGAEAPLSDLWKFDISSHQWTWMGGSITSNQAGVYGTLGTAAPGNMPGSRYGAAGWKDLSGDFWLFGGYGNADNSQIDWLLNDLWKFNPSTNQWTWMGGSNTLTCTVLLDGSPDCAADPGVYGQRGTPNAANIPGSRFGAMAWTDPGGKFWLFGGDGYDSTGTAGNPNDMWMYDPSTSQWTWENGSITVPCGFNLQISEDFCTNPPAVLGTLGVPAPSNTPPGSTGAATWVDRQGNLWLFGSNTSLDVTGTYQGRSSDLWVYLPSTNQWAWMGGDFATSNCAWINISGYPGVIQYVCQGSQGVSGSQYQSAIGNEPASRSGGTAWTDKQGNFWLFGGETTVPLNAARALVQNPFTGMNDLWKFQPSATTLPPAASPILSLMGGSYLSGGPLVMSNGMATSRIYYTTDGSYPTTNSSLYAGPIDVSSNETVSAIAVAPGYINSGIASASYLFLPQPATPVFSPPSGTYDSAQTVSLSESAPYASIEYTTDGSAPGSPTTQSYTGPIAVSSTETINAMGFVSGDIVTRGIANIDLNQLSSSVASATYTINLPQPNFTVAGTAVNVIPGATSGNTSTITLTPSGGFTGTVNLRCAITPTAASDPAACSLPQFVTISGTSAQTTTLTVNTTAATSALNHARKLFWPSVGGAAFACVLLLGFPARRWKWQTTAGILVLIFLITCGEVACGGGSNGGGGGGGGGNPGTTAGTYTITVTGTSGAISQTGTVVLTVQ